MNILNENFGSKFPKAKFSFDTTLKGLIAFTADFEKHLNSIKEGIPVYFLNIGDGTYYNSRFEVVDDSNEIYKENPRCVFKIATVEKETEPAPTKNVDIEYVHENKLYRTSTGKLPLNIPIECNFVCPNFVFGMHYFEILMTIFLSNNTFSYINMNNSYSGNYSVQSYNFEFPQITASSEAKNFIINYTINLNLPIYLPRYETITELHPSNRLPIDIAGNEDGSINRDTYSPFEIQINTNNSVSEDSLVPDKETDNITKSKCD